jgi:hypothetical protein
LRFKNESSSAGATSPEYAAPMGLNFVLAGVSKKMPRRRRWGLSGHIFVVNSAL